MPSPLTSPPGKLFYTIMIQLGSFVTFWGIPSWGSPDFPINSVNLHSEPQFTRCAALFSGFNKGIASCRRVWYSALAHSLFFTPGQPQATRAKDHFFSRTLVFPFAKCHVNGIMQYRTFSDWLLSDTNMHLRFLCVFGDLIAYFFLFLNNIPLFGWTTICYQLSYWGTSWLLPGWGDYKQRCNKHSRQEFFGPRFPVLDKVATVIQRKKDRLWNKWCWSNWTPTAKTEMRMTLTLLTAFRKK